MVESSPTVDQLLEQEQRLRFEKFGVESGLELGGILLATALERDLPIVLDVYCFGQTIFRAALPGSSVDNSEWIRRKCGVGWVVFLGQVLCILGADPSH